MAVAVRNPDVYFFARWEDGKVVPWLGGSSWKLDEFWVLTRNPRVKTIYAIDPRPDKQKAEGCGVEHIWWRRGDASTYNGGQPVPMRDKCWFWPEYDENNLAATVFSDMVPQSSVSRKANLEAVD
jgi:hypothetical protein